MSLSPRATVAHALASGCLLVFAVIAPLSVSQEVPLLCATRLGNLHRKARSWRTWCNDFTGKCARWQLYFSDYRGGDIDATGWGGYGLVSWFFAGHQRTYRPRQGLWGPINAGDAHIFEVFARSSYTYGNDDVNSSNSLGLLTLGGNWYHGRYRGSANLILANTKRDLDGEDSGNAVSLRFQFLF